MRDHIQIFRSEPEAAHRLVQARGISYLALCPKESELGFYAKKDPQGLWAQVNKGNAPAWLKALPDRGEGIQVWQVR